MLLYIQLALPNNPTQDLWAYFELLSISPKVLHDHLVIVLQVPLVDKSPIMYVYKVYNLLILHPAWQKAFHHYVDGEYLALSSDSCYGTISSEYDMLTRVFTRDHMCENDTALCPTEVSCCLYALFVSYAE